MPPPAKLSQVQSVWTSRCILLNVTNLGWWVYWVIGTNLYLIDQVELFQPAPSKVKIVEKAWVPSRLFEGFIGWSWALGSSSRWKRSL